MLHRIHIVGYQLIHFKSVTFLTCHRVCVHRNGGPICGLTRDLHPGSSTCVWTTASQSTTSGPSLSPPTTLALWTWTHWTAAIPSRWAVGGFINLLLGTMFLPVDTNDWIHRLLFQKAIMLANLLFVCNVLPQKDVRGPLDMFEWSFRKSSLQSGVILYEGFVLFLENKTLDDGSNHVNSSVTQCIIRTTPRADLHQSLHHLVLLKPAV